MLRMRCVLRHTVSHAQTGVTGFASPRGALQGLSAPSSNPPVSAKSNSMPPKDTLRYRERPAQGWAGIIISFEPSSSHLSPTVCVCGNLMKKKYLLLREETRECKETPNEWRFLLRRLFCTGRHAVSVSRLGKQNAGNVGNLCGE